MVSPPEPCTPRDFADLLGQALQRKKAADAEKDEREAERRRREDGKKVQEMKEERQAEARRRDMAERKKQEKDDAVYKKKLQAKLAAEKEARAAERKKEREAVGAAKATAPEDSKQTPAEKARAAIQAQKKADAAAKKAVQDRIAADRAERRGDPGPASPAKSAPKTTGSGATKIAFRLPGGRVEKHSFPAGERLEAAIPVVEGWVGEVPRAPTLKTAHGKPPRVDGRFRFSSPTPFLGSSTPKRIWPRPLRNSIWSQALCSRIPDPSTPTQVPNRNLSSKVQLGGSPSGHSGGGAGLAVTPQDGVVAQLVAFFLWLFSLLNPSNWGAPPPHQRNETPGAEPSDSGSTRGARPEGTNAARRAGPVGTPMGGGGRHVTLAELNRNGQNDRDTNERYNGDSTSLE